MAASEALLLLSGSIFFPFLFYLLIQIIKRIIGDKIDDVTTYTIALRSVSTIQSIIASTAGFIIMSSCKNVLYDSHWLATAYVWFGVTYFYYDTWAMYFVYWHKHSEVQKLPASRAIRTFMSSQPLMMLHHLVLPLCYLPIITYYRRGIGDFFVGCFYTIELAVPFISLRAILLQLGQEGSLLYNINGLALLVTFTVCRVLIFPFMYWQFGLQQGLSVLQVMLSIPVKCNAGCGLLLLIQLHWLKRMVAIFVRTVWIRWIRPALNPSAEKWM